MESEKSEFTLQQDWQVSGNKASVDPRQNRRADGDMDRILVSGGVHRIGMVACFISEIWRRGVSRPKNRSIQADLEGFAQEDGNIPAWKTFT